MWMVAIKSKSKLCSSRKMERYKSNEPSIVKTDKRFAILNWIVFWFSKFEQLLSLLIKLNAETFWPSSWSFELKRKILKNSGQLRFRRCHKIKSGRVDLEL